LPSKRTSREKKRRFSSEYTMLSVLEYLYANAQKTPVSKYNILTNTPGIKQQRTDRINLIMDTLEQNEYIKSVKTSSNVIFYQITEKGAEAYSQWIKAFLNFARATSNAEQEDIV
jgi:DNA-binding PadR family transcriptional regulator